MKRYLLAIILVTIVIGFLSSVILLNRKIRMVIGEHKYAEELAYFPSGRFLRPATLGFNLLAADFIWLRLIQYYGGHRMTDRKYGFLYHILEVLTTLDTQFVDAYTFGSLLLAESAQQVQEGLNLLDKGISYNHGNWRLPFTKGFIHYNFTRHYTIAAAHFYISSRMSEAPDMCARFAAFSSQRGGDREAAKEMWTELYNRSNNPYEKEVATRSIRQLEMLNHLEMFNKAIKEYHKIYGIYPENIKQLLEKGFIDSVPKDPTGGQYFIDFNVHRVRSTSYRFAMPWWDIIY